MNSEKESPSLAEVLGPIALAINFFTGFAFFGVLAVFIFGGKYFVSEDVYPIVVWGSTILLITLFPVSLVLLFFKATRALGGFGIFLTAMAWGISVWLFCFMYAWSISKFWTIIGLFVAGIGVVPVAVIQMLWRQEWFYAGMAAVLLVVSGVFRHLGLGFIAKSAEEA